MEDNTGKKKQPRLKDVATSAGVSPTTASMIFSGTGRISDDTRRHVMDVAGRMGYVHEPRKRRTHKSGNHVAILMLVDPEWSFIWHFLTEMIRQIQQDLDQLGLKTVLVPISHHDDDEIIYQKINKPGCRSVFSVHIGKEKLFAKLEAEGIPVIVILNNNYQDSYFSICVDDFEGAYEGTRHLLRLGHSRIDFVDSPRVDLPALSPDRYFGYRKALEEAGVRFLQDHRINCRLDTTEEELERCLKTRLADPDPPTALFCLDDEIAFRTWNALSRQGFSIPKDVSILAPGDVLDYSKPYIPQISTMHIDMTYVGRLAAEMLSNRMKNDSDTVHVLKVKQQLTERGSILPFAG